MKSGCGALRGGELIIIRHGATDSPGTLNGRTDVGLAATPKPLALEIGAVWVSPARRARETAAGLFPGIAPVEDARLWEQDFGVWDGRAFADIPDVGELSREDLAALRAEGGESFHDMVARVRPALEEAAALAQNTAHPVAVVAHAGIARVALAMAMGADAAALAYQIAHLGATRLTCYPGGFAVTAVNERLT